MRSCTVHVGKKIRQKIISSQKAPWTHLTKFLTDENLEPYGSTRAKLPELSLKPFSGELTELFTYWDGYKAAIHDNVSISDINKFMQGRTQKLQGGGAGNENMAREARRKFDQTLFCTHIII